MAETVLVLGATAGIAQPLCELLAGRGCRLVLTGRDAEALAQLAGRIREAGGGEAAVETFDATAIDEHEAFFERCVAAADGEIDGVVLCHGHLPIEEHAQRKLAKLRQTIDINYVSAAWLLELVAGYMEKRGKGWVAVVSSVAGDRGRRRGYIYSSTKAAVTTYAAGLRGRLHASGVHLLTIKPGYVDTKMIAGRVEAPSWAIASPQRVARSIDRAIRHRRNVIYTPWFWRPVLFITRAIPEAIFKRLDV